MGDFLPSMKVRAVLVDTEGTPYKAGSAPPGGLSGDIQFNESGVAFGGITGIDLVFTIAGVGELTFKNGVLVKKK